jgi:hypothetical protein
MPITAACHDRRDTDEREQSSSKRGGVRLSVVATVAPYPVKAR